MNLLLSPPRLCRFRRNLGSLRGDLRGGAGAMPKGNAEFDGRQPAEVTSLVFGQDRERPMGNQRDWVGMKLRPGAAVARRFGRVASGSPGSWTARRGAIVSPRLANCRADAEKPATAVPGGPGRKEVLGCYWLIR